LVWIFALPYDIPGQRKRKDSALQILRNRFAAGEITAKVYEDMKAIIKKDLTNN
jgi:putative membrane protein